MLLWRKQKTMLLGWVPRSVEESPKMVRIIPNTLTGILSEDQVKVPDYSPRKLSGKTHTARMKYRGNSEEFQQ
jgi:hypothetical protein